MSIIEEKNAKIIETFLGREHGIFTFIITLRYESGEQGFGTYSLDQPTNIEDSLFDRAGTSYGLEFIIRLLKVIGVISWE